MASFAGGSGWDGDKDGHKNVYKKGVDLDEGRRRRQETTVNIRKQKNHMLLTRNEVSQELL